jgi:putative transcriptional regulator
MAWLSGAGRMVSGLTLCLSFAQFSPAADLAPGRLLVASRQVSDPTFAGTVVLLISHESRSAVGLIVNRRSEVPLSSLLPGMPKGANASDPVFVGGPVGKTGVVALVRSRAAPVGAARIFADVYLVSEKALLEKVLAAGARPDVFRVYLGYAGWTSGRLEKEVAAGSWHILPADSAHAFDPEPDSLWTRLMQRIEGGLARSRTRVLTRRSGA